jgi:hypothetical protein
MRTRLITIAALAVLALPATAGARTITARGHGVTASFSFSGEAPQYTHQTLTITRGSTRLYHGAVTYPLCGHECGPTIDTRQKAVQIAALDGAGSADVLVDLYTGGAHCCFVTEVFRPSAALGGLYVLSASHDFGDPGDALEDLGHDGDLEFVTADDAFAYEFTDFAASGLPLQILRLQGVRFVNVTADYPARVRADAARWLTAFRKMAKGGYPDSVGVIAAWVADECTLGRSASALAFLARQEAAGHLNSALGTRMGGARFVARLKAFLGRQGYLR